MTVAKGTPWGTSGPPPDGLVVVGSDAELFEVIDTCRREGRVIPPLGLTGGDLWRAAGGAAGRDRLTRRDLVALLPVDLVRIAVDTGEHWSAVHVVARRGWCRGPLLALMNAEYLGTWDVAPRAHPGDGRVDVVSVDAAMPVRQRWAARRRLPSGSHVPHPHIHVTRVMAGEWTFDRPTRIRVDSVEIGTTRRLRATVEPDALLVCV